MTHPAPRGQNHSLESYPDDFMNIMHSWRLNLVLALILAAVAPLARAQIVLYDNTDTATSGNIKIADVMPLGDSFSTGAAAVNLTSFSAVLGLSTPATGSTTFSLHADSAGNPGDLIAELATIDDTSLTGTYTEYTFSGLSVALDASTRYWILAESAGAARWISSPDDGGTGVAGEFLVAGAVYPNTEGPMAMSVTATPVPEPATYAMIGGTLALALGFIARRQPRKTAFVRP